MKKILVPTDFSECAGYALNQAKYMAGLWNAELHIFHVTALDTAWQEDAEVNKVIYESNLAVVQEVERQLSVLRESLTKEGHTVITGFDHDNLIDRLETYTEQHSIDLIVMGTHGISGVREWIIGSNTQKLLRKVNCPVLAIKHDLVYREFKRIAFVSNYHEENEVAFKELLRIAGLFDSELILLNMDEPGTFGDPVLVMRKAMREYQEIAEEAGFKCSLKRIAGPNIESELQKQINEEDIDLIVVPTHGRSGFSRIFSSSIAEAIVNHLDKPVMTIKI